MNKRGHIATAMLFFGTIVLVTSSLFSFYLFSEDVRASAEEFHFLRSDLAFNKYFVERVFLDSSEKAINSEEIGETFKLEVLEKEFGFEERTNFFGRVRAGDFSVLNEDGKIVIEVKDVFVKSEIDGNEIVSRFNLRFDK